MISSSAEVEAIATSVTDTGGVYFVPAFGGLLAPRWRPDARGVMVGITGHTRKAHIVRAALEAVAFQTKELLNAMTQDAHHIFGSSTHMDVDLRVDGEPCPDLCHVR